MYEAKARYAGHNGLDASSLFLSEADVTCRVMSAFAPLVNAGARNPFLRKAMELTAGVDSRRAMPRFSRQRVIKTRKNINRNDRPRVALFRDLFARYNSPELAQTVVILLEELTKAEVLVTDLGSCGITAMAYGNTGSAFRVLEDNLDELSRLIEDGYTVVSQEPTSVLTLRVEAPGWSDDPRWKALSAGTFELFEHLRKLETEGRLKPLPDDLHLDLKLAYHMPCHLKALQIGRPGLEFLKRIAALEVVESRAACCGIAGTFGMKKEHFALSMKIGERMFEALAVEGVRAGLSECSTCRLQMEQSGKGTYHPAEILAAALGIAALPAR